MTEPIIHDGNYQQFVNRPDGGSYGLIPRDFEAVPYGSMPYAPAFALTPFPQSEWSGRAKEKEASGTRLSDVRNRGNFGKPIPSLYQNGQGYCWKYGGTACMLLLRALANMPFVGLTAHGAACIIKNYQDQGGWCGESLAFQVEHGEAPTSMWPLLSMSRSNDTPALRVEMAKYKVTEGFYDLAQPKWNQKLSVENIVTSLLLSLPCQGDFNFMGHSVCLCDVVDGASQRSDTRMESGKLATTEEFDLIWGMNNPVSAGMGIRYWNSYGDQWGANGMGILTGNQVRADGAICLRVGA